MAAGMQFVAAGDSLMARDVVLGVFTRNQWRINMKGDWEGTAEHGSRAASFWGGAFAGKGGRHVLLNIKVAQTPDGNTMIELIEGKSGFSGGIIGVTQAKEVYQEMYDNVGVALTAAGLFIANTKI